MRYVQIAGCSKSHVLHGMIIKINQTDYTDKPLSLSDYRVKLLEDINYSY